MKKHLMVTGILLGMFFHAFSQDYPLRVREFKPGEKTYRAPGELLLQSYGLTAPHGAMLLEHQSKEKNGKQVYRLQQTYSDIPIENAVALIHVKNGYTERIIANWPEAPVNISAVPGVTVEKAVTTAVKAVTAKDAVLHKNKKGEAAKLLLRHNSGRWQLAYEVFVETRSPFDIRKLQIDAHSGVVLSNESTGHSCCTPATAALNYNGTKTILTDESGPGVYRLRGCIEGSGDSCTSAIASFRTAQTINVLDFTHTSTDWTGFGENTIERCALDAHWGAKAVFDYYFNPASFNQNIFYGEEFVGVLDPDFGENAVHFTGQSLVVYGHNSNTEEYWTSLDIVAHELTHQVTSNNSNLIYEGESGAINEAMSDIYAVAIEAHYGGLDWLIADDVDTLRDLSNPNHFFHPDTYQGFHWESTPVDGGGVHTNSGVINYWFYLLVNGGTDVNDLGNAFHVDGMGMANAIALMNELQSNYLIATTDMHDMRELAMIAAGELWGYCSAEYIDVVNAFYAVGIGEPFNVRNRLDETWETDLTSCSAILHWEDIGVEKYGIKYWAVNSPSNTFVVFSLVNEVTLYNLLPGTVYEWEVFALCGTDIYPADHTDTFETTESCPNLEKLEVSNITTCSAELMWTETSTWQFRVDYQAEGASGVTTIWVTEPAAILSDLLPNTTYTVWATPHCGDSCTGNSDSLSFTTSGCQLQNLSVDINSCYFNMNWDIVEGQTYEIVYSDVIIIEPDTFIFSFPPSTDFFGAYTLTLGDFVPGSMFNIDITITCTGDSCTTQETEHFEFVVPEATEGCDAPSNIAVQYIDNLTDRVISWDGPDNTSGVYNVEIIYSDGSMETYPNHYGNSLVTLDGNTSQCFRIGVQAICGCADSTITGVWGIDRLCPPCEPPTAMFQQYLCSDYVSIFFSGPNNAVGYQVRYWPASDPGDITTLQNVSYPSFGLDGLTPYTTYIVELSTMCDPEQFSTPIYFEFTTDPKECAVPTNISSQLLNNGGVRLEWSPTPGADYYEVDYLAPVDGVWVTVQTINNYVELPGLLAENCGTYIAVVRAVCGDCAYGSSANSPYFYFPECTTPDFHIGLEADQKCNPCEKNCYVCIVDDEGQKINTWAITQGYWYSIDWTVPEEYGVPASELANRECIDMGPDNEGQTFTASFNKKCFINGVLTDICLVTLTYTHRCERRGDGGDGGIIVIANPLADGTGSGSIKPEQQTVFSIYPNPGTKDLNLVNRSESEYLGIVLDAYGRSLKTIQAGAGSATSLKTEEWPAGVYYIRMKMQDGTETETLKWVKL